MVVRASDLLRACRVAEGICEGSRSDEREAIRGELGRLWEAYDELASLGEEGEVPEWVAALVTQSAHLESTLRRVTLVGTRTEELLAAWRHAEMELDGGVPGTLSWLMANSAVDAARHAYHARVKAISLPSEDGSARRLSRRISGMTPIDDGEQRLA